MIKIVLADKNRLFRQSLKAVFDFNGDTRIVADVECADELLSVVPQCSPEVVLTEIPSQISRIELLRGIIVAFPGVKFIALTSAGTFEVYNQLINIGVKGCVHKEASLQELMNAINDVANDRIYYPREFLLNMVTHQQGDTCKHNNSLTGRELQVLQLLCDGFSNEEISDKLHLSYDTVKWHRSNILLKCGCRNILSLYKHAIRNNLIHQLRDER